MADPTNYRQERIERLLNELKYEITRGMIEGEIDERLGFVFVVPISRQRPDGVVMCRFETRPEPRWTAGPEHAQPRLRIVGGADG